MAIQRMTVREDSWMAQDWSDEASSKRIRAEIPFRNLLILILVFNGLGWWGTRELNQDRAESLARSAQLQEKVVQTPPTEVAATIPAVSSLP